MAWANKAGNPPTLEQDEIMLYQIGTASYTPDKPCEKAFRLNVLKMEWSPLLRTFVSDEKKQEFWENFIKVGVEHTSTGLQFTRYIETEIWAVEISTLDELNQLEEEIEHALVYSMKSGYKTKDGKTIGEIIIYDSFLD